MTYSSSLHEPALDELFADPIVQLLMKRDGVISTELHPLLEGVSEKISDRQTPFSATTVPA